jgi:mono/diheme cytochrome c family protein
MKNLFAAWIIVGLVAVGCQSKSPEAAATGSAPAGAYVAVQSTFTTKCAGCHGAGKPKGGIDLRNYESVLKGGGEGPVVKAGDPANSMLIKAIKHLPGAKPMPMGGGQLPPEEIKAIEDWVQAGAKNG